jgi:uncharacterized membrane protein (DUF2068 family)
MAESAVRSGCRGPQTGPLKGNEELSYIVSALSVARHAVALTLIASAAATTMVAGAVDQGASQPQPVTAPMNASATPTTKPERTTKPEPTAKSEAAFTVTAKSAAPEATPRPEAKTADLETLVGDCLAKYAALKASTTEGSLASEACRRAILASGLTSTDFWSRYAPKTEPTTVPQKPTANLEELVKDCLTKYAAAKTSTTAGTAGTAAAEACRRAIEASGLTSTEFWARFAPKTQPSPTPVKPSTNTSTDIEALAKYCITKYTAAKDNATAATAASEVCRRAIEASGLSATEFWAKFGKTQSPKTEPKPTATPTATELTQLTRYCLAMHAALTAASSHEQVERTTTLCDQAIAESKLTATQFWTKFTASR